MKYLRVYNNEEDYNNKKDFVPVPNMQYVKTPSEMKWRSKDYYKDEYLTFTALESGTFTFTMYSALTVANFTYAAYSLDDGATWVRSDNAASTVVTLTTPTVQAGDKVLWKGKGLRVNTTSTNTAVNSLFSSTGQFDISGNIMSMLFEDSFNNKTSTANTNAFSGLFQGCVNLVNAENLFLGATTLTNYCYFCLFRNCTSLISTPRLNNAKTIPTAAYGNMFQGCTSLTTAPELPATSLSGTYAYSAMFSGCTSLTTAMSELPATSLSNYCYQYMFDGCSSLTTAPVLKSTTWANYCYRYMFQNCSSLNYIKCMATSAPTTTNHTVSWVDGVSATGTFVRNTTKWTATGISSIPAGWTITAA